MRQVIQNISENCVGCNRCQRVCPINEATVTREIDGKIVIDVDQDHCIACGACIDACHHGARDFEDDTDRFFNDLKRGMQISMFAAPAAKTNFEQWGRVITWLRECGVKGIYDVSLGADICTWAHIRYLQKHGPKPIISQPCPAIVNYVLKHKNELIKYLSPVHSPMLCTAVYMNKYAGVNAKIAGLSPCIAKTYEFDATGFVEYNVTFKNFYNYIKRNNIDLPKRESGFDHFDAGLGSLYPMPGGLKENVEFYIGKSLRVDKAEGQKMVYDRLDEYFLAPPSQRPVLFDVLNCPEGCNLGTGCNHDEHTMFTMNTMMDKMRQDSTYTAAKKRYLDELFETFDEKLRIDDFIRVYKPTPVRSAVLSSDKLKNAWISLGKFTEESKIYDCGACGSDSCIEMAERIAKGIDLSKNCLELAHSEAKKKYETSMKFKQTNLDSFQSIIEDTAAIKEMIENISSHIVEVNDAIETNRCLAKDIEEIAKHVSIIAVNASIEAARAGEHGKAFAQVAEEIRKLALSSSTSAQKTTDVSVKASNVVGAIKETVNTVNENIHKFYDDVSRISKATTDLLKSAND